MAALNPIRVLSGWPLVAKLLQGRGVATGALTVAWLTQSPSHDSFAQRPGAADSVEMS